MSDANYPPPPEGGEHPPYQPPPPHLGGSASTAPLTYGTSLQPAPPGTLRSTGVSILLFIVTLGIYGWYWTYQVHDDMKRRDPRALDPLLALLLVVFLPIVMIFMTPKNIGDIYAAEGREQPVSGWTGWWHLIPLLGGIIWFVKTNGAINRYWQTYGGY